MKKLFWGLNITWKKLIVFAVICGVYTATMMLLPITNETSFRDIGIQMEWWILFGIIIISNSKSPVDSALKCFVFFLISQPLIYLIQVPFSSMGFGLFSYYRYWFIWTLLTIPMGYIGYYIKKNNLLSVVILLPMLMLLAFLGLGYFSSVIENFPYHLLSCICCFLFIAIITWNIFDKNKFKVITLLTVVAFIIGYTLIKGVGTLEQYESYKTLDNYGITFVGDIYVSLYSGTEIGDVEVVSSSGDVHSVKLKGAKNGRYTFTIVDGSNSEYSFEYYYDKTENTVILNKIEKKVD